ncbi:MAG: exodeoxyribonuclease VII small subunit [Clostridia bacterium]|nr:exodeoxyribonuclease VII small subunit [Clostridia bacterium]
MAQNKIDFEKSLGELESIIKKLESGDCTLDESITLFEQGIKYTNECRTALKNAQAKIISLTEAEEEEA